MNKFASIAQSINPIVAKVLFSLVILLSSLNVSEAATEEWINLGSMGTGQDNNTHVTALAVDPVTPSTVYASTNFGGVFKSTNGGGLGN